MTDTDWLNEIEQLANAANDDIGISYSTAADEWLLHCDKPTMQLLKAAREDITELIEAVRYLEGYYGLAGDLIDQRDKAREECGHEKAMRKSISEELDRFIKDLMTTRDERDALAAKLARVEALHQPHTFDDSPEVIYCGHCQGSGDPFAPAGRTWPCSTITALNEGDQK